MSIRRYKCNYIGRKLYK